MKLIRRHPLLFALAIVAAMLVLSCAPLASAQPKGGPMSTDQGLDDWPAGNPLILNAAMDQLRSGNAMYNHSNFANFTFFPHSESLHQGRAAWQRHFKVIQSARAVSGRLSVAGSGAQPGDIVLLYKQSGDNKPHVLVYAGEQSFPDEQNMTRSFFVYPYAKKTGMQFNTFPARWTARDMQKYGMIKPKPKKKSNAKKTFVVSNTKQGARFATDKRSNQPTIEWLRSPPVKNSVFARPTWFSGATYEVLRENFAVNYRVAGVRPLNQPKNGCWATVATMMIVWKLEKNEDKTKPTQTWKYKNKNKSDYEIIKKTIAGIDQKYYTILINGAKEGGLKAADKKPFLKAANLRYEYPQNLSAKRWEQLLKTVGPVWVTTDTNLNAKGGIHARLMIGIEGDGTNKGTKLTFINPTGPIVEVESLKWFVEHFEAEIFRINEEVKQEQTPPKTRPRTQIVHF